jgi:hypothetical protein
MKFKSLDDVRREVDRIATSRHTTTGNWTAAQIFYHLAGAFQASLEGRPPSFPKWVRFVLRSSRWVVTRFRFPPFVPIPASVAEIMAPPADADLAEQHERLTTLIDRFEQHSEPHPPHPVLGALTREEWVGFHLRHCQRHLSFVRVE